jgi:hypothetical protein
MPAKKFGNSKNISILQLNKLDKHGTFQSKSEVSAQAPRLDPRGVCH